MYLWKSPTYQLGLMVVFTRIQKLRLVECLKKPEISSRCNVLSIITNHPYIVVNQEISL